MCSLEETQGSDVFKQNQSNSSMVLNLGRVEVAFVPTLMAQNNGKSGEKELFLATDIAKNTPFLS